MDLILYSRHSFTLGKRHSVHVWPGIKVLGSHLRSRVLILALTLPSPGWTSLHLSFFIYEVKALGADVKNKTEDGLQFWTSVSVDYGIGRGSGDTSIVETSLFLTCISLKQPGTAKDNPIDFPFSFLLLFFKFFTSFRAVLSSNTIEKDTHRVFLVTLMHAPPPIIAFQTEWSVCGHW